MAADLFHQDDIAIMPVEAAAQRVVDLWREGGAPHPTMDAAVDQLDEVLARMRSGPTPSSIALWSTVREAASWLKARLLDGAYCPCCGQRAQLYERKITSTMARALIQMWRHAGIEWCHLPTVVGALRADEAKLVHWGLIEEENVVRDDGGRAGFWRVTDLGVQFVQGEVTVPKHAYIYNKRCHGLDGDQVGIQDCLGDKFRLDELLGRAPVTAEAFTGRSNEVHLPPSPRPALRFPLV